MLEGLVRSFLYHPLKLERDAPLPDYAAGSREVWIDTELGDRVHGLYWPAPPGRPTVLFFHGNAQSVYEWALVREELVDLEAGMLLVDYPGYGKSSGSPREEGLYSAGLAASKWLEANGVGPGETILFGKSLGGPVSARTAAERGALGMVLESTFRSLPKVIRRLVPGLPAEFVLKSELYETEKSLSRSGCPLLVVHGTEDELIPVGEGKALYAVVGGSAADDQRALVPHQYRQQEGGTRDPFTGFRLAWAR